MGLFSGLFGARAADEDYEAVLAALKRDIEKRRVRLSEIRLRERRAALMSTLYALAGWALYVSLWYMDALPRAGAGVNRAGDPPVRGAPSRAGDQLVRGAPVFVGPVLILLARRLVQMWYKRKGDAEEKALSALAKQQHAKIEEIKKKTNYYQMREMMAKYDGDVPAPGNATPPASPAQRAPQVQMQTPQRRPVQAPRPMQGSPAVGTPQTPQRPGMPIGLQSQLRLSPPQPLPPPRKQWYDKLADAILGDDEPAGAGARGAAANKFALICAKCFAHNGLAEPARYDELQYKCPKCGHFNPSPRTLREGQPGASLAPSPISAKPSMAPFTASSPGGAGARSPTSPAQGGASAARGGPRAPSGLRHDVSLPLPAERDGSGSGEEEEDEGEEEE